MIEDILNVKLNPKEVLNVEVSDEVILNLVKELNLICPAAETFEDARKQHMRSEEYFYYAVYRGYKEGLRDEALVSFASVITSLIPGLGVSFSTDAYFNEEAIEHRAVDQYNILQSAGADPLTCARGIVEFLLNEYKNPEPAQTISKTVRMPIGLIKQINDEEGDNFSDKTIKILRNYFKSI